MNKVVELFGNAASATDVDWAKVIAAQKCPFLGRRCYKVRKSTPEISIGSCTVLYRRDPKPVMICPTRLIQNGQIFTDCLHLLSHHEPGNELHLVPEVTVPGGSIDYVLVSTNSGKVCDFVGIELQTLDTTGSVWPERQRLLKQLGVERNDNAETDLRKTFGMNWKMTAKTILVQMHHKVQTFEHVNRKLVLVVQDKLLAYMQREFKFDHVGKASLGDSMHFHSYRMARADDGNFRLALASRLSTDADGIGMCLGLQAEARIELEQIVNALQSKISPRTLFRPI